MQGYQLTEQPFVVILPFDDRQLEEWDCLIIVIRVVELVHLFIVDKYQ